jgi:hypothetical protein
MSGSAGALASTREKSTESPDIRVVAPTDEPMVLDGTAKPLVNEGYLSSRRLMRA